MKKNDNTKEFKQVLEKMLNYGMHEDEIEQILLIFLKISILQMDVKKDQQALEKLMSAKTLKELESIDKKGV